MHSLLRSVGEDKFRRILSLINEKRKKISNRVEHISYEDVLERVFVKSVKQLHKLQDCPYLECITHLQERRKQQLQVKNYS
jgi:aspartate carbamoyltransferase regulatory subunit